MNLANQIKNLLVKNHKRSIDIHKVTGMPTSSLSRIITGKQTHVSDEDLERIASVVAKNKGERALLIRARMLDLCKGPGSELIDITIKSCLESLDEPPKLPLDEETRKAFYYLMKHSTETRELGPMIISLAKLLGRKNNESVLILGSSDQANKTNAALTPRLSKGKKEYHEPVASGNTPDDKLIEVGKVLA